MQDIAYNTLVTEAENKPEFVFATDTPYLSFTGELWGFFVKNLKKIDRVIPVPYCNAP